MTYFILVQIECVLHRGKYMQQACGRKVLVWLQF
jgi:hypothetical protein